MNRLLALAASMVVGVAIVAIISSLQPHFNRNSVPYLICNVILAPGNLVAAHFPDVKAANPEFIWRSRMATAILFAAVIFGFLSLKKPSV